MTHLAGSRLLSHVQTFAGNIGPRPAGHPAETAARNALEQHLRQSGITDTEQLPFSTTDTWGYGTITPLLLAFAGNVLLPRNRILKAALSLAAAQQFWLTLHGQMRAQPLYRFYPQHPGGTLIARLPAQHSPRQKIVLIGHTDTNKHRLTFSPTFKRSLRLSTTSLAAAILSNALASLFDIQWLRRLTAGYLGLGALTMFADELGGYVEGANDNGSGMACVLGLAEQAMAAPLSQTELWLAFTGSEEVSHDGLHILLDRYGDELRDAYFLDIEMVGKGTIHYVQRHTGIAYFTGYRPDSASLQIAATVAAQHPELAVTGREAITIEEVATLRRRGFRGICLVGLDADGYLGNWHRRTDVTQNIDPAALERAARFAWAMIQHIDRQAVSAQ